MVKYAMIPGNITILIYFELNPIIFLNYLHSLKFSYFIPTRIPSNYDCGLLTCGYSHMLMKIRY